MNTPETRTSDNICDDCGQAYLSRAQRMDGTRVMTFHQGQCGLCEDHKPITHIENYNFLKEQK